MSNPFGITEVDIPGALGAYEAGQTARVNRLFRMQQLQMAERQAERDAGLDQVIARVTGQQGKTGAAGAYAPAPSTSPQPANAAAGAPSPAPVVATPSAIPQLSQEDELALRMGGERGVQIATAIRGMNDQQRELTNRRAAAGGQVAQQLLAIPDPQQRSVALQHSAPVLLANGFTQDEINGYAADLSDASLGEHLRNSRLVAAISRGGEGFTLGEGQVRYDAQGNRIAAGPPERPRYFPVQAGGRLELDPSYQGPVSDGVSPSPAPTLEQQAEEAIRNGANPEQVRARLRQMQGGAPAGTAPAFSSTVPLTLEDRRSQYPVAPGRAGPQGPRTFR